MKYTPPYSKEEVIEYYGQETFDKLFSDPAHRWRMESGIELIHKEPTYDEFERIWDNWNEMSDDQKKRSDEKSIELFGCTNTDHALQLEKEYSKETKINNENSNDNNDIVKMSKDEVKSLLNSVDSKNNRFDASGLKKAFYDDSNEYYVMCENGDKTKPLAICSVRPDDCGHYISSITSLQKGCGAILLKYVVEQTLPCWLIAEPMYIKNNTYGINDKLLNGFYRGKCSEFLKEYKLEDTIWNCPVSFFYNGIEEEEFAKYIGKLYKPKKD